MQSTKPLARMRLLLALCMALALTACVNAPPIVTASSACSALLPEEWRKGVPGATLPLGATVGDWVGFADAQTAQLDKANERTKAAIGIVERCEARDREAVKRSRHKVLGIF